MTLFTSGDWIVDCERILTFDLFDYKDKSTKLSSTGLTIVRKVT